MRLGTGRKQGPHPICSCAPWVSGPHRGWGLNVQSMGIQSRVLTKQTSLRPERPQQLPVCSKMRVCSLFLARFLNLIFSIREDSTHSSRKRVCVRCAARASRSGRGGWGHTGSAPPRGALLPLGVGVDMTLWPLLGPVTTSLHQRHWNVTGNPAAQSSAHHKPGLGAKKLRQENQPHWIKAFFPLWRKPTSPHPQSRSSSHTAPRRVPQLQMGRRLVGQVTLSPSLCSLSNPAVLILTGGLQLRLPSSRPPSHPAGLARTVLGPRGWKGPVSRSQLLPASKPQNTSEDTQSHVQGTWRQATSQTSLPPINQLYKPAPTGAGCGKNWVRTQDTVRSRAACSPEKHCCSS